MQLRASYSGSFTWQDDKAVGHLRRHQPSIIVNDRTDAPADFLSREGNQAIGNFDNRHPLELCTTLTTGAWGYQPNAKAVGC
jgi:alpha-L-fucosidase